MSKIITKNIPKPTEFGKNLRILRRWRHLSQSELALQVGLNRNKIASYENNVVEPNALNFLKICDFFQIQPERMLSQILHNIDQVAFDNDKAFKNSKNLHSEVKKLAIDNQEAEQILNGYSSYYKSQYETNQLDKDLYNTLHDLLRILDRTVQNNSNLIDQITRSNS